MMKRKMRKKVRMKVSLYNIIIFHNSKKKKRPIKIVCVAVFSTEEQLTVMQAFYVNSVDVNSPVLIQHRRSCFIHVLLFQCCFLFPNHRTCQGSTWKKEKRNGQ